MTTPRDKQEQPTTDVTELALLREERSPNGRWLAIAAIWLASAAVAIFGMYLLHSAGPVWVFVLAAMATAAVSGSRRN